MIHAPTVAESPSEALAVVARAEAKVLERLVRAVQAGELSAHHLLAAAAATRVYVDALETAAAAVALRNAEAFDHE